MLPTAIRTAEPFLHFREVLETVGFQYGFEDGLSYLHPNWLWKFPNQVKMYAVAFAGQILGPLFLRTWSELAAFRDGKLVAAVIVLIRRVALDPMVVDVVYVDEV